MKKSQSRLSGSTGGPSSRSPWQPALPDGGRAASPAFKGLDRAPRCPIGPDTGSFGRDRREARAKPADAATTTEGRRFRRDRRRLAAGTLSAASTAARLRQLRQRARRARRQALIITPFVVGVWLVYSYRIEL